MTRPPISHRMLAAALALIVGTPLLASKPVSAIPTNPVSETTGDCLSNLKRSQFGDLSVATPTPGQPNVVRVSYVFGPSIGRFITSDFRFFYSTPEGAFAIPRASIASVETIQGSFDVPAITGQHRIRIVVAYVSPPDPYWPRIDFRLTCETTFDVVSLTTTTKPTATTIAPTTAPVATTTTVGIATTVAPTTAPTATTATTATATTTPAATTPATTVAPTPSSTAPPATLAATANSATKTTKAKRTVKNRKSTKKTKRPATTVKR
jgi:hypothetical protein